MANRRRQNRRTASSQRNRSNRSCPPSSSTSPSNLPVLRSNQARLVSRASRPLSRASRLSPAYLPNRACRLNRACLPTPAWHPIPANPLNPWSLLSRRQCRCSRRRRNSGCRRPNPRTRRCLQGPAFHPNSIADPGQILQWAADRSLGIRPETRPRLVADRNRTCRRSSTADHRRPDRRLAPKRRPVCRCPGCRNSVHPAESTRPDRRLADRRLADRRLADRRPESTRPDRRLADRRPG
jgi:hypothetical protein